MDEKKEYDIGTNDIMPLLPLRGISIFPDMLLNFDVERPRSVAALNAAMAGNQIIFLVTQKEMRKRAPGIDDLYQIGTICRLTQLLRIPGGNGVRAMVEGIARGRLNLLTQEQPCFYADVTRLEDDKVDTTAASTEALIRHCYSLFDEYAQMSGNVSPDILMNILSNGNPSYVSDYIAQNMYLKHEQKQELLDETNPLKRLNLLCDTLSREIEILDIEQDISERARQNMGRNQREYYLRQQLRAIQSELGEDDDPVSEAEEYRKKIQELTLTEEVEEKLLKELNRLSKQSPGSAESSVIRTYLDACIALPWNKKTKDVIDIEKAAKTLNADHFGLEKVKDRILEFLAVKQLAPDVKGGILCLVGPPGVGKTSIAISVAKAMNRKLARLSLGGVHDEADIRGHRKTYIGAMPGRIIHALTQSNSRNPVMVLDEIDKLGRDYRGDPSSALLEALDPEQNYAFRDHYLEIPFDLSEVFFITTANTQDTIPRPLLDRMEVIEVGSYTDEEKLQIAKRHLFPKQRKKHGLTGKDIRLTDDALREVISQYTRESGVRVLERQLASICRKTAKDIASGNVNTVRIKAGELEHYLGAPRYKPDAKHLSDEVGLVRGLAWTQVGGEVLDVEVNVVHGNGKLELTGNLGDVMKESARAAVSYVRSRAAVLGVDPKFYKNRDIHIHFPEGAVPKDGPSAGITICVAVISALTGVPVRRDIAMTGEITLRGRILPIGGLKEKTMAALRAGINTVIIPADNEKDLEEIDQTVRGALNFVTADHVDNILDVALARGLSKKQTKPEPDPIADIEMPPPDGLDPTSTVPIRQ